MSISDPLFDLGSLWYDPEPLEFPKLVPYNKSRSSNPNKVNIRNLLVFSCKLSIQYTECFILQCAFQLALIDRNIPVRLSYSWVPNKRVYLIIIFGFFPHPVFGHVICYIPPYSFIRPYTFCFFILLLYLALFFRKFTQNIHPTRLFGPTQFAFPPYFFIWPYFL